MSARDAILGRVHDALGATPEIPAIPRDYRGAGTRGAAGSTAVVDRFAERVADYRATVHRCAEHELPERLAALVTGERAVATALLVPLVPGLAATDDPPLSAAALDGLDAVVTGCALAIAETGTFVLDGGAASGRRALTLVPDHHVCVVHAAQVVADVPDAIAALHRALADGRPLTLVSGPSATSDIELERVEGVHGPRRLDVVLVG
jgi:L-lactate dehydrogenase complex protein LldG